MKTILRSVLVTGALLFSVSAYGQADGDATKPANDGVTTAPNTKTVPQPINVVPSEEAAPDLTSIAFEETTHDFGEIIQGDVVKHMFKFTNTGDYDLILENVKPSCGCTALNWPRDAIAPGKTGEIEAQFNSAHKMGQQQKFITLIYNGNPKIERVVFKGNVVPKPVDTQKAPPSKNPLEH